jgi:RNA polymerase sigma factor (sigma-70 family)
MDIEDGDRVGDSSALERTGDLIEQARRGDRAARDVLFGKYRNALARFLHARLPYSERILLETEDLVQEASALAFSSLDRFEYRGIGSFWRYLRRIGLNQVLKAVRRGSRRPESTSLAFEALARPGGIGASPVVELVLREDVAAFEDALEVIEDRARDALLLRFELGAEFDLIARECGFPTADAARMAVRRAIARIARVMGSGHAPA